MVKKIFNTKEVSSEYQKIKTKLVSHIDNKIKCLFNRLLSVIIATCAFSSFCIIGLITPPLLIAINIASGSEAFYFTLEKASFIFGMTLLVFLPIMLLITAYKCRKIANENPL